MEGKQNSKPTSHGQLENQIVQGSTIRSDLLIAGTKVYSDASWQKKNIQEVILHLKGLESTLTNQGTNMIGIS